MINSPKMSYDLMEGLTLLGFPEYYDRLLRNGVESWEVFLLLTDEDLQTLDIESDHRKTILRIKGILELSQNSLLTSQPEDYISDYPGDQSPHTIRLLPEERRPSTADSQDGKSKYRHHLKADSNAPSKPLTAYVVFANEYQNSLTQERSLIDIAKEVGRAWQALSTDERGRRENEVDKWNRLDAIATAQTASCELVCSLHDSFGYSS